MTCARKHEEHCARTIHSDPPVIYQIRVKGHLDVQWADWFENLTITLEEDGNTLLSGPVEDQAALHALLRKVRDLGLPLIAVISVPSEKSSIE